MAINKTFNGSMIKLPGFYGSSTKPIVSFHLRYLLKELGIKSAGLKNLSNRMRPGPK